jgi:hypothetical protein
MADYIAVETGNHSAGYLVANGNVYPATSGSSTLLDIPQGTYTYGGAEALSAKQYYSMTDAPSKKKKHANKTRAANFRKFHIGTGPKGSGVIPDSRRPKQPREGIEFHYDGGGAGTAGCIGYQDNAAKDALIADPAKSVNVKYVKDMDAVKAEVEKKLGHKVDWEKVTPLRKQYVPPKASGTQSKNKKSKKVVKANKTVLLGPNTRETAHRLALLESGVKVVDASTTVFVGPERLGVARVDDMTSDGSPIADGEISIMVG